MSDINVEQLQPWRAEIEAELATAQAEKAAAEERAQQAAVEAAAAVAAVSSLRARLLAPLLEDRRRVGALHLATPPELPGALTRRLDDLQHRADQVIGEQKKLGLETANLQVRIAALQQALQLLDRVLRVSDEAAVGEKRASPAVLVE